MAGPLLSLKNAISVSSLLIRKFKQNIAVALLIESAPTS
jgi:cation transport ATPase